MELVNPDNFKGHRLPGAIIPGATLTVAIIAWVVLFASALASPPAPSQTPAPASTPGSGGAVLTVVLRDSHGKPLAGARVEVLSYDWGLQIGEPYHVIAVGQTDQDGQVRFDDSQWPYSGYRFKFSKTAQTQPADTYFMPESENQYRGYPAARVGGSSDTQYFAIAADGLAYNDLADGQGSPYLQKDPVGGMNLPRVSPSALDGKNFMATARAATATAYAGGAPTPTLPPTAAPFRGVQQALNVTPQDVTGQGANTPGPAAGNRAGNTVIYVDGSNTSSKATPAAASSSSANGSQAPATETGGPASPDRLTSGLMAVFGLLCLITFVFKRRQVYEMLGLNHQIIPRKPGKGRKANGKGRGKAPKAGVKPGDPKQEGLK